MGKQRHNRLNYILAQQAGTGDVQQSMAEPDITSDPDLPEEAEQDYTPDVFDVREKERIKRGDIFAEAALEAAELESEFEEASLQKRHEKIVKAINTVLIAACIYVVFLIYGVICTEYQYTAEGRIEPTVMSVEELREKKDYEVLLSGYIRCRAIYEDILILDYRLGQGIEDPVIIANDYTALLDAVSVASMQNSAAVINSSYAKIQETILYWIQNDAALYLQYMSDAITTNNPEAAAYAVMWRGQMYEDFLQITSNIVATGDAVKGVDMVDIKEWTPDDYIYNYINSTN